MKYVVIYEIPDTGFMDCVGIYEDWNTAVGAAYLALLDGEDEDKYCVSDIGRREGDCGVIMYEIDKATGNIEDCVTILEFKEASE